MPKFYCEYCGIYLTHSSPSGRGQHAKGRKHINNRIEYYKQVIEDIQKENQDKLKQIQGAQPTNAAPQPMFPGPFQNLQQLPMLQQLQQLKAGGIQQVQINSNQQGNPGVPPIQPPLPILQPPFMNMPKGGPGMPPPPLRPGQQPLGPGQPPLPMGMMPPNNMMPPPGMMGGMKLPGMPPMGPPGQFLPPGMMGPPPHNMPPMQFQPPPHLAGNPPFNLPMDLNKGGPEFQVEEKQN